MELRGCGRGEEGGQDFAPAGICDGAECDFEETA